MSDVILLAEDQKAKGITCESCGDPAICLDGYGEYLCGWCANERYPLTELN